MLNLLYLLYLVNLIPRGGQLVLNSHSHLLNQILFLCRMHTATIAGVDRKKIEMAAGRPISVSSMLTLAHKHSVDLHVSIVVPGVVQCVPYIAYSCVNYQCISFHSATGSKLNLIKLILSMSINSYYDYSKTYKKI